MQVIYAQMASVDAGADGGHCMNMQLSVQTMQHMPHTQFNSQCKQLAEARGSCNCNNLRELVRKVGGRKLQTAHLH